MTVLTKAKRYTLHYHVQCANGSLRQHTLMRHNIMTIDRRNESHQLTLHHGTCYWVGYIREQGNVNLFKVDALKAGKISNCKDLTKFDKEQIVMARRLFHSISKAAALVTCSRSTVVTVLKTVQ